MNIPHHGHPILWLLYLYAFEQQLSRQEISHGMLSQTLAHGTWYIVPRLWFAQVYWVLLFQATRYRQAFHPCQPHDNPGDNIAVPPLAHEIQNPSMKKVSCHQYARHCKANYIAGSLSNSHQMHLNLYSVSYIFKSVLRIDSVLTSKIVSVPNSFLHWSISSHICAAFSTSNFLAFKNLHTRYTRMKNHQLVFDSWKHQYEVKFHPY